MLYCELPFILLGDSGQRDPEIYAQVVRENPGRVLAIYIRNVSRDTARVAALEQLAAEVARVGSTLLLAADTFAMAEHAARRGLIAPAALQLVGGQARKEGAEPAAPPTVAVTGVNRIATRQAVSRRGRRCAGRQRRGRSASQRRGGAAPPIHVRHGAASS